MHLSSLTVATLAMAYPVSAGAKSMQLHILLSMASPEAHTLLCTKDIHAVIWDLQNITATLMQVVGGVQGSAEQLGKVVDSLKQLYGLRYIYCWHGLSCYWSGVSPYEKELKKYKARLVFSEVFHLSIFQKC